MAKERIKIPAATEKQVMKEFNHRCAVCGEDKPQLHHIDEDPSNNDPLNLVPICPNCHLGGIHDASNEYPKDLLAFFRKHKHRQILAPQFRPLFRRMQAVFASGISGVEASDRADELTSFVANLQMGPFYLSQCQKLFAAESAIGMYVLSDEGLERARREDEERERAYLQRIPTLRAKAEMLVVELLDFQTTWMPPALRSAGQRH